jgi:hypothetical protein
MLTPRGNNDSICVYCERQFNRSETLRLADASWSYRVYFLSTSIYNKIRKLYPEYSKFKNLINEHDGKCVPKK